jgi:hypothetical protein
MGGSGDDVGRAVALDAGGNAVVVGAFQGSVDFGGGSLTAAGSGDLFVAGYAAGSGAHRSSRRFGGLGYQYAAAAAIGPGGTPVVAGYFQGTLDLGDGASHVAGGLYDGFVATLVP